MEPEDEDGWHLEYTSDDYVIPCFTHMSAAEVFAIEEGCTVDGRYREDM